MDLIWLPLMTGGGTPGQGGSGSAIATFVWIGLMFAIMYLLLIRPQRKKAKEQERLLSELKKGDKVVTNSGLIATIFAIDDEHGRVFLKINEETKLEFLKSSIVGKVEARS